MLTGIDATPHNTLMENYNLGEKNKHKYSFDILAKTSVVEPLDSPPRVQMPAPRFLPPLMASTITATQMPSSKPTSANSASIPTLSSSTYIAPAHNISASVVNLSSSTSSSSGQSASTNASPSMPHSSITTRPIKETLIKPLKTEKVAQTTAEKQNSTLENDLELSDSDDDRKKQNRSTLNSSDSSPSDSSESGTDSSKSESQQSATIAASHQPLSQQPIPSVLPARKKVGPSSTAGSGSSSGLGSSAPPSGGSSSSSSNKTPSPSNTTKWQLSRYFNKVPLQTPTQDVVSPSAASVVNSMNVANINMPITLRGGAQIIPEPPQHVANIKNESLVEEGGDVIVDDNNIEDENLNRRSRSATKNETFPHPAFPSRKPPAGLSVTPLSPMLSDIKKELSSSHIGNVNQQQVPMLNASEFVSIPSTQIKREAMSIAGGHTTVTAYEGDVIEGLSNLSSDTNDSDEERMPVRGPGGTLKIRGVPAAVTALPRSPPLSHSNQMLNSVTMIRLDSTKPSSVPNLARSSQSRTKKPRKKLKQQPSAALVTDTSDEEQEDLTKRLITPVANTESVGLTSGNAPGPKKGRGRPRKTASNQSGNISSASSASTKGPTLTAKKDVNKKPAPLANSAIATVRRRASRLNSLNTVVHDVIPTTSNQIKLQAPVELTKTVLLTAASQKDQQKTNVSTEDSSSSSESFTCSISKTSSSGSNSDMDLKSNKQSAATNSSSSEDDDTKNKAIQKITGNSDQKTLLPKRIVKKLNTRKSSLEDLTPLTSSSKPQNMPISSSSSSSSSESSAEDFSHLPNASSLTGGCSQQMAATAIGGSFSTRSANHQSPLKVASAFFSESSGEERSDSDSGQLQREKVKLTKNFSDNL